MSITPAYRDDLYRMVWRMSDDMGCKLLRIGGIPNHIHILLNLNPVMALSKYVQHIKGSTSNWMKGNPKFPLFNEWAAEYYAATVSSDRQDALIEYIKNQEIHHMTNYLDGEFEKLLRLIGMKYDDRDFR